MPRNSARIGRVSDQIQRDLADLIRTKLKDPLIGFVTLTDVEVTPDYRHAKVFYTVLGDAQAVSNADRGLKRAAGFLRSELAATLRLRIVPELHFVYDESVVRGEHLSRLIDKAVAEDNGDLGK